MMEDICSTKDLYEAYEIWAERNSVKPRTENSFARDVKQRAPKLGMQKTDGIDMIQDSGCLCTVMMGKSVDTTYSTQDS